MTQRYDGVVNGNYLLVGNGVLECTGTRISGGGGTCNDLHSGSTVSGNYNDYFAMRNATDAPALTAAGAVNSSRAIVTVPSGAEVVKAELYWSGNSSAPCGSYGSAATPSGQNFSVKPVMIQVGNSAVTSVPPTSPAHSDRLSTGYYSAHADVTSVSLGQTVPSATQEAAPAHS